jgi:hypothetical protein
MIKYGFNYIVIGGNNMLLTKSNTTKVKYVRKQVWNDTFHHTWNHLGYKLSVQLKILLHDTVSRNVWRELYISMHK